jgi:hypothetical protein
MTENLKDFFLRARDELGIHKPEDWYNVTASQVKKAGGGMFLYP